MLIVVAPSSSAICTTSAVYSTSERVASIGRELDVVDQRARVGDGGAGLALDVLAGRGELVLDVDVRRRHEGVDPRSRRVPYRAVGGVDVPDMNAGEAGDHRALDLAGDRLHGLEVAGRGDREAGLDDVHAQPRELVGDLELLGRVQRDARRLLAVSQGGVEDENAVVGHVTPPVGLLLRSPLVCGYAAATRYSPRGGRRRRRRCSRSDIAAYQRSVTQRAASSRTASAASARCSSRRHHARPAAAAERDLARRVSPRRPPSRRTRRRGARRGRGSGCGSR